jgi:hypothetical protein
MNENSDEESQSVNYFEMHQLLSQLILRPHLIRNIHQENCFPTLETYMASRDSSPR